MNDRFIVKIVSFKLISKSRILEKYLKEFLEKDLTKSVWLTILSFAELFIKKRYHHREKSWK